MALLLRNNITNVRLSKTASIWFFAFLQEDGCGDLFAQAADAVVEKFGGDSLAETKRNLKSYLDSIPAVLTSFDAPACASVEVE